MFHIVFDTRGAELLTEAMDMDDTLDGETILFRDDYSVGPIRELFSEEGRIERMKWWVQIRDDNEDNFPGEGNEIADAAILQGILTRMEEEEFDQIWIWVAPNARDVCGYYWVVSQLRAFSGRVYVIHLNNLPFISEKGSVFYPGALAEIAPREFVKAKKLARPVTPAEFETDPDEWFRLASENKNLRLLEGGKKITQQEDDYFDKKLVQYLPPVFQKISKTIHQFLLKSPEKINETFLHWRLQHLIASGDAEQQGGTIRLLTNAPGQTFSTP